MNSPRNQFTPLNSSNVFTSTIHDEVYNTSFSSYNITPRQILTPEKKIQDLQKIDEQYEEQIEADTETYRDIIKQLSTQLQALTLENRSLSDRLNLLQHDQDKNTVHLQEQNQSLIERNFKLQEKINQLFQEIQNSQQIILDQENSIKTLKPTSKLEALIDENAKLITIIETQQGEIKLQKEIIEQYEIAFQDQKSQQREESKIEGYKQQIQHLQEQIQLWSNRYQSLENNYQIQYNDLLQKFTYSQAQVQEMQKYNQQMSATLQQNHQQQQSSRKYTEAIEDLKQQLDFKKNQIKQLQEELLSQQDFQKLQMQKQNEVKIEMIRAIEEQIESKYVQKIAVLEKQVEQPPSFEANYYQRDSARMKLYSDRKGDYRGLYNYKENLPDIKTTYNTRY